MADRVSRDGEAVGDSPGGVSDANAKWSRCEAALQGSGIAISSSDMLGRYTWAVNSAWGTDDAIIGRSDAEVLPLASAEAIAEARRAALATGGQQEIELEVADERGPRWYDVRIRAQRAPDGGPIGTVLSAVDITDRKVQEEHLRIVLRELAHRSKNLLAVIQGIARQTAESALSTQQFVSRFNGRIYSLSRAHDVLTDADWRGAGIFDLVQSQIALYAENRLSSVDLEGDNSFLRPNAAQYIGLALHELTTNAIKYGALSRPDGHVEVRFEAIDGRPDFCRFTWTEASSAAVKEPKGRSFGLMMLCEVVPTSVSGAATIRFEPAGIAYELEIPRAQLVS